MRKPSNQKKDGVKPPEVAPEPEKVSDGRITVTMTPAQRKRLDAYLSEAGGGSGSREITKTVRPLIEAFLDEYEGKTKKPRKGVRDAELIAKALSVRAEKLQTRLNERELHRLRELGDSFRSIVISENDMMISKLSQSLRNELEGIFLLQQAGVFKDSPPTESSADQPLPRFQGIVSPFLEALGLGQYDVALDEIDKIKEAVKIVKRRRQP